MFVSHDVDSNACPAEWEIEGREGNFEKKEQRLEFKKILQLTEFGWRVGNLIVYRSNLIGNSADQALNGLKGENQKFISSSSSSTCEEKDREFIKSDEIRPRRKAPI